MASAGFSEYEIGKAVYWKVDSLYEKHAKDYPSNKTFSGKNSDKFFTWIVSEALNKHKKWISSFGRLSFDTMTFTLLTLSDGVVHSGLYYVSPKDSHILVLEPKNAKKPASGFALNHMFMRGKTETAGDNELRLGRAMIAWAVKEQSDFELHLDIRYAKNPIYNFSPLNEVVN